LHTLIFKSLDLNTQLLALKPRLVDAHKGDFGHVLVIGGEYGMGGAVRLAGEAALRTGAGLVSIATRPEHAIAIMGNCPELMCHGIRTAKELNPLLMRANVVVIGPGLGSQDWGEKLFKSALQSELPLVVDADALKHLASADIKRSNWILTPHPGEAALLLGQNVSDIQADRERAVTALREQYQGVIVLKGAGTLILGEKAYRCYDGNPGMATAGMGDVLSGIIAGLIAQKLALEDAANLGVSVHAVAGDTAALKGERGLKASDLFEPIHQCLNP